MPASKSISTCRSKSKFRCKPNSKSSKETYWAHDQGLQSEKKVIEFYLEQSFALLGQRVKTPFAEVYLLFRSPEGHVLLVEVKTANIQDFQVHRITYRQKQRLLRALQFLAEKLETNVEVHWAFVTNQGQITIIEDVSG